MKTMKTLLAAAALAGATLAVPALAREDMDADKFVTMCDADKDGMVSKAEVMKHVEKMFEKHDRKKSGKLDRKQVEFFLQELMRSGA